MKADVEVRAERKACGDFEAVRLQPVIVALGICYSPCHRGFAVVCASVLLQGIGVWILVIGLGDFHYRKRVIHFIVGERFQTAVEKFGVLRHGAGRYL